MNTLQRRFEVSQAGRECICSFGRAIGFTDDGMGACRSNCIPTIGDPFLLPPYLLGTSNYRPRKEVFVFVDVSDTMGPGTAHFLI